MRLATAHTRQRQIEAEDKDEAIVETDLDCWCPSSAALLEILTQQSRWGRGKGTGEREDDYAGSEAADVKKKISDGGREGRAATGRQDLLPCWPRPAGS